MPKTVSLVSEMKVSYALQTTSEPESHPILLVTDENLKLRVGFPFPRAILPVTRGNSILKLYLHGKCFLSLTL